MEAVYFGTFSPMHKGHISNIIYAKRKYDFVHIVASGYDGDRGFKAGIPLNNRYRVIREIFNNDELVSVYKLDEINIKKYPNGWDEWIKILDQLVSGLKNKILICAEKEYCQELVKRGYKVDYIDRSEIPISSTKIRDNPYLYWEYIHSAFRKFFTKKVLVYGSASTGKTTLTRDLANFFNTTYTKEYSRYYQQKYNVHDEELDIQDFANIGIGQFNQNKYKISSSSTNKIFFADTDVMTTYVYLEEYLKNEDTESVKNIFSGLIDKQHWDLILFLQPDITYINDGFRDMRHADQKLRIHMNCIFKEQLEKHNLKYVELTGMFDEKFALARKLSEELIKIDNK